VCFLLTITTCFLASKGLGLADDFPPLTEAERALKGFPAEPNARAVILDLRGDLRMPDPRKEATPSILTVSVREKILTERGLGEGTVRIVHSSFTRLHDFEGRTILPDGTAVPLPGDASFTTTASKAKRWFVTAVPFPKVEVGAILDYHYKLYWDTFTFLEPWYFAGNVPVIHSEILYHLPAGVKMRVWGFGPGIDAVKTEQSSDVLGKTFRVLAENLSSLPAEPYSFPAGDFSPRMMLVPRSVDVDGLPVLLLENWQSTCGLYKESYRTALRDNYETRKLARSLVTVAEKDARAKATALFRYVRDNVRTDEGLDPAPENGITVDNVLARKHGTSAEKALLLLALLDAVKVPAHLVWAGDRADGLIDLQVPTPAWFSRTLVAVETGTDRLFLDPTDSTASVGHIAPGLEGMPALLYDYRDPAVITLPERPFAENRRLAQVDLAVGEKGEVTGHGSLTLTGHHGWEMIGWKGSTEQAAIAWKNWLQEQLKSFVVSDVSVKEAVEDSKVEVEWRLAPAEVGAEEDEILLNPAAPLGPVNLASSFPAAGRQTPVVFDYPDRDEVEWHLSWSAGWGIEATPQVQTRESTAGAFVTSFATDSAARTLVTHRRFDISRRITESVADYDRLRQLLLEAQRNDAQTVVLRRH
jgi:transglutaminase-like putative cysteine protease